MTRIVFVVEDTPDGGYIACALAHSIFAQGETADDLRDAVYDAVRSRFRETERPQAIHLHFAHDNRA